MARQKEREQGARPPVCQYCAAIADTRGPGLPVGWTIQSGVRGWTYLCAQCTRSNLRSIESRLFEGNALGFDTVN
ncbi:MAG TPA: hypothetical protein VEY96_06850 [Actinomycetes bacterium]|nr:hypothetical protein [Actinomycetes bacterium]